MNVEKIEAYRKEFHKRYPAAKLQQDFKLKYIYNSALLDGGSLSAADVEMVMNGAEALADKSMTEMLEVKGHLSAYDYLFLQAETRRLSADLALNFHQLLYQEADLTQAGCFRLYEAMAPGSLHTSCTPQRIGIELMRLTEWVNDERGKYHPVELAAQLHKRFAFIRPFNIGNGKVARLLMNLVLLQDGYPPAIIAPSEKKEYYALLEEARRDDKPFVNFIARQVLNAEQAAVV